MEFRILGPLEVSVAGQPLAIGGARTRAVLALAAGRGQPSGAGRHRCEAALASTSRTDRAAANLQVRLSELRRALRTVAQGDRLQTRPPGYRLRVDYGELDVLRFERLVAAGRGALASGDADAAVRHRWIRPWRCGAGRPAG